MNMNGFMHKSQDKAVRILDAVARFAIVIFVCIIDPILHIRDSVAHSVGIPIMLLLYLVFIFALDFVCRALNRFLVCVVRLYKRRC